MAEGRKERVDRLAKQLQELSDFMEAVAVLQSGTIGRVDIELMNPSGGHQIGQCSLASVTLASLLQAEVDGRVAALVADNVQV